MTVNQGRHADALARSPSSGTSPRYLPRAPGLQPRRVCTWAFADQVVREALTQGRPVAQACDAWHSGAYLLETVTSMLTTWSATAATPRRPSCGQWEGHFG